MIGARTAFAHGDPVNARFIDWIWNIKGSLALAPEQSGSDAFDRLDPLFRESGTSHERTGDTLTFRKKDQAAQDKMSIFDGGVLQIERGAAGSMLHYRLTSRALLFCFLAPLLFLGFAGLTIVAAKYEKPPTEAADKAKKDKKEPVLTQNPIDKFLGAPAPEKPKKDKKDDKDKKKNSPTTAYVFAAIFAALYVAGRILEDRLVKGLFRKRLLGS
jgi:hypothetical protein